MNHIAIWGCLTNASIWGAAFSIHPTWFMAIPMILWSMVVLILFEQKGPGDDRP